MLGFPRLVKPEMAMIWKLGFANVLIVELFRRISVAEVQHKNL